MYVEGTILECTGKKEGGHTSFKGEDGVVFNSRKYGLGIRFKTFDYGDEDDPFDSHSLEHFTWKVVKKERTGLIGFLKKHEEKG